MSTFHLRFEFWEVLQYGGKRFSCSREQQNTRRNLKVAVKTFYCFLSLFSSKDEGSEADRAADDSLKVSKGYSWRYQS